MKFPSIYHLPFSPGVSRKDKVLDNANHFIGKDVIKTEKLDGENTSLLSNKIHARSETSTHHPSQSLIKQFHAIIKHEIPPHIQIVGENMFAKHSIYYDQLTSYFYVFAVIDLERKVFLSIDETEKWSEKLELNTVPVLDKGNYSNIDLMLPQHSTFGKTIEGFVIRDVNEFFVKDIQFHVAKYVRKNHVQTNKHWTKMWSQNKLRS